MISDKIKSHMNIRELDLYPSYKGKTLNIEIASGCNEKCIYCKYYAMGMHKQGKLIDEDFFYRITKEAKELGITDVGLYMTAEPLVNPKVYDYIRYLKKELKFQYVYISTNGILCTPSNLEKMVDAGIDSIKFSVSSADRENFKRHHGVDAVDKVFANIKYAYEYREKNQLKYKLYMFSILTKYNLWEKELIKQVYSEYVDELLFSNVLADANVKGVEEYLTIPNEEKTIITEMALQKLPCMQLFERIVINQHGYLCACCFETVLGYTQVVDLKNISLKEGVYGEQMVKIRQMHLEKKIEGTICKNCIYGRNEKVEPLNKEFKGKLEEMKVYDVSEEIRERFGI